MCIWDLDETLVVLQSLISGSGHTDIDTHTAGGGGGGGGGMSGESRDVGFKMQELLLEILEGSMFYNQLEGVTITNSSRDTNGSNTQAQVTHLGAYAYCDDGKELSGYDFKNDGFHVMVGRDGKPVVPRSEMVRLAYRYRKISEDYTQQRLLRQSKATQEQATGLRNDIDRLCGGRLKQARETLRATTRPRQQSSGAPPSVAMPGLFQGGGGSGEVINVVLSDLPLCSSLAQCVVCGLDGDILAANVYSSWQSDTASVLQQIMARFEGAGTSFVCVQRVTGSSGGGEPNGRANHGAVGGPTGRAHAARTKELTKACSSVS